MMQSDQLPDRRAGLKWAKWIGLALLIVAMVGFGKGLLLHASIPPPRKSDAAFQAVMLMGYSTILLIADLVFLLIVAIRYRSR